MSHSDDWIRKLERNESLTLEEASAAAHWIATPDTPDTERVRFLLALNRKGETSTEIAGFAQVFRSMATDPGPLSGQSESIDVCGTGGDGSGTFNISTAVGFLLASMQVPVLKHGNRSITSKCGSADILEALGWPLTPTDKERQRLVDQYHFIFLFAPVYHPAFQYVGPARKQVAALGQRSIFNLLGPLLNPARPPYQLMGVMGVDKVGLIADALNQLEVQRGLVVHCQINQQQGLDEASTVGTNHVQTTGALNPQLPTAQDRLWGLSAGNRAELQGGDMKQNLKILDDLVRGKRNDTLSDTVALNAGLALWVAQRVKSPEEGIEQSLRQLRDGNVYNWLRKALA
jgi:anthranilate phosphoribosyltransferase